MSRSATNRVPTLKRPPAPLLPSAAPQHLGGVLAGMVFAILALSGFEAPAPLAQEVTQGRAEPGAAAPGGVDPADRTHRLIGIGWLLVLRGLALIFVPAQVFARGTARSFR